MKPIAGRSIQQDALDAVRDCLKLAAHQEPPHLPTVRVMTLCWLFSDIFEVTDFEARTILSRLESDNHIRIHHGSVFAK